MIALLTGILNSGIVVVVEVGALPGRWVVTKDKVGIVSYIFQWHIYIKQTEKEVDIPCIPVYTFHNTSEYWKDTCKTSACSHLAQASICPSTASELCLANPVKKFCKDAFAKNEMKTSLTFHSHAIVF